METKFYIDATPIGKGRPRVTRHGTYTPKKTQEYEKYVKHCFVKSCEAPAPLGRPLFCIIRAYFPVPKSYTKKQHAELPEKPYTKKPDADNIVKSILDALNGIAYEDDSAICEIYCTKYYTARESGYSEVFITDSVTDFVSEIVGESE